jgi:hypothetical protein
MVDRNKLRRLSHRIEAAAIQFFGKPIRMVWAEPDETAEAAIMRHFGDNPKARDDYEVLVASWLPAGAADQPPPPGRNR